MRVVHLIKVLKHYRVPFHEGLRTRLAAQGVEYQLLFGQPETDEALKRDEGDIAWATPIHNRYFRIGGRTVTWQPALRAMGGADLVILDQENRLLINYVAQALRHQWRPRIALWGHGRNYQAERDEFSQHWKRYWATRCDWWFAYTTETQASLESYGFPSDRISVTNNAIDTSAIRRAAAEIDSAHLDTLRGQLGIATENVGVYVGGLYRQKRIEFLLAAAAHIRERVPDFTLLVIGDGEDRTIVEQAAAVHPWVKFTGARFGREKVALLRLGKVFLMPGLVGLAILDCMAAGVPLVTTAYPYHSPEVAYLEAGRNGLMVNDWQSPSAYAEAVVSLLVSDALHNKVAAAALATSAMFTIEQMVVRFADGIQSALVAPKYHRWHRGPNR